jgi:Uma2 family endonuclease
MAAEPLYVPNMTSPLMTAEELLHLNIPDKRTELVRGRLIVREPAGYRHGAVTMKIAGRLFEHVELTGVGQLLAAETGFTLFRNPDTVRAPDVGFVRQDRIPTETRGFPEMCPDLAVEVLSPDDRPGETLAKVGDWLEAGVRLVWVIDPERRIARVYRPDGTESLLTESDELGGEDVLPGFRCALSSIL